jgi:hypothetical protein
MSILTGIGEVYYLSPVPKITSTWIYGHSWIGASCAVTWLFDIIPVGGCAVQQTGIFFGPRFGMAAPYTGYNVGWTFAQNIADATLINAGFGYYHFDAIDVWAATDGVIVQPVYAGAQLFG